jgi:hypothetical protein
MDRGGVAAAVVGHRAYRPIMEELNRRKAIVAGHPTAANCCRNLEYAPDVAPGSMELGKSGCSARATFERSIARTR